MFDSTDLRTPDAYSFFDEPQFLEPQTADPHAPELNTRIVRSFVGQAACFVDVRTMNEWLECHMEGALHIPLASFNENMFASFNRHVPIFVFSQEGTRSRAAATLLREWGFSRAYSIKGGLDAWRQSINPGNHYERLTA